MAVTTSLLTRALSPSARRAGRAGWFILAVLGGAAAIAARADIVILFHLYIIVPLAWWLNHRDHARDQATWKRLVLAGGLTGFLALAAGCMLLQILAGAPSTPHGNGSIENLAGALLHYLDFIPLVDGLLEWRWPLDWAWRAPHCFWPACCVLCATGDGSGSPWRS